MTTTAVDRAAVERLLAREIAAYERGHPASAAAWAEAREVLPDGVPMNWMVRWCGSFPLYAREAVGARLTDVDGHVYVDFALGDTGALFGHGVPEVAAAIAAQAARGTTMMLPTGDAAAVARELARRFGLPFWQFAVSATDANRFALRLARAITGRRRILVFNGCYHGNLAEALVRGRNGVAVPHEDMVGAELDAGETTRVVEFNDPAALERALAEGDVACVLAEPALTNCGVVPPAPGYHERLRALTRRHGALLVIDETHTISCGPGGYVAEHGLEPDIVTLGKPIGGGIPVAVYGFSRAVAEGLERLAEGRGRGFFGIGGTLAGNALAVHAVRAMLEKVMVPRAYERMSAMAERLELGIGEVARRRGLAWHAVRLGSRVNFGWTPRPPASGGEALLAADAPLDRLVHLYLLNRGVLIEPFLDQCLLCPAASEADVDLFLAAFDAFAAEVGVAQGS